MTSGSVFDLFALSSSPLLTDAEHLDRWKSWRYNLALQDPVYGLLAAQEPHKAASLWKKT